MVMDHQKLVNTIMDLDKNIRFATICNMAGTMEVTEQRKDIEKFLTLKETQESLKNATKAWIHARTPHFKKIGKGLYTLTAYEKLRRVTIPLLDGFLLLVTIDNKGELQKIIDKILKQVRGTK